MHGPHGDRGLAGARGQQGEGGQKGALGEQGLRGPTGFEGSKGITGDPGPDGAMGPAGSSPLYSVVPNSRQFKHYYRGIAPAHSPKVVMDHYLMYLENEIDNIKYPIGSKKHPATTCSEIYENVENPTDGYYWIDPNRGCIADAIYVFCNFTASGETCIESNSSNLPFKQWHKADDQDVLSLANLLGIERVTYGSRKAQINFLRLLSVLIRQEITIDCARYPAVSYFSDKPESIAVEFVGWNYKHIGSNSLNMIRILKDTCRESSRQSGSVVIEVSTSDNLKDLPIIDIKLTSLHNENEKVGIRFGKLCFE